LDQLILEGRRFSLRRLGPLVSPLQVYKHFIILFYFLLFGSASASNKNQNPDPHQDDKLNPDPHPDPYQGGADPQHWLQHQMIYTQVSFV
jgi:hypothetical protein